MKKYLLSLLIIIALVGCGKSNDDNNEKNSQFHSKP